MITLSPARRTELANALLESFKPEDLDRRVMDALGVPPADRSASQSIRERVRALLDWARVRGQTEALLRIALEANPSSQSLQRVSEAVGLVAPTENLVELLGGAVVDPDRWRFRLSETQRLVCGVQAGPIYGTGFLVGPDQVMTHRILFQQQPVAMIERGEVKVRFGEQAASFEYHGRSVVFADRASGIVVFRLDRDVGRALATEQATRARARGWIVAGPTPTEPAVGSPVVIVQTNAEGDVRVSVDTGGFLGREGDTIRYRTSTHLGSAGSPCFDVDWHLIGVHAESSDDGGGWNAGVSIHAILRDLSSAGCTWTPSEGIVSTRPATTHGKGAALDAVLERISVNTSEAPDSEAWEFDGEDREESWAWAEAAAVVATYVPEALKTLRPAPASARVAIQLESEPVGDRWMISDKLRTPALRRLARRAELQAMRALNAGDPDDPLDRLLGAFIQGPPPDVTSLRDPVHLRAAQRVVSWLDGVITPLPNADELTAQLERATLIAPFRHLTQGFFAGRQDELAELTAYVDRGDKAKWKPVLIHGPGGMGKSALLAHFVLTHSERDPSNPSAWRPFVYLDFDRADLDAADLSSVLIAILRQLGPQVPAIAQEARKLADDYRARHGTVASQARRAPAARRTATKRSIVSKLAPRITEALLATMRKQVARLIKRVSDTLPEPILLVFDTLEEVQYANPDAIRPLVKLAIDLRKDAPRLRPVLAGRIEPDSRLLKDKLQAIRLEPLPQTAREALLGNKLPSEIAGNTDLVTRLAESVGGNPLSLQLAAAALRREPDVEQLVASLGPELWKKVGDAIVQGRLYERILGHITDGDVHAIAYPGLIVRKLTRDVIKDVLAVPCGLTLADDAAVAALFRKLAAEVALVTQGDTADVLELRPELRRVVLDDFQRDEESQAKQRQIHELAVAFYARRFTTTSLPEDRAEEIYHRLALDQDPETIDRLWITGIDNLLRTAVDDFASERARSFLATRVGMVADDALMRTASAPEWEDWAEQRTSDLLRFRSAERALEILEMRPDRLPTSRLHLIESVVRRSLSPPDLIGAAMSAQQAVDAARRSGDTSYLNEALEEFVLVSRLRHDSSNVLRGLAELGHLGDLLGDDLVVLEAAVTALEAAVPWKGDAFPDTTTFTDTAIKVFGRLPDELIARAPELARRVAAQVGAEDPATLQRVLRLVGPGALAPAEASSLEDVLKDWSARSPDIVAFLPSVHANANDVANAAQYLSSHRTLDVQTSSALTNWLKSVVTPSI